MVSDRDGGRRRSVELSVLGGSARIEDRATRQRWHRAYLVYKVLTMVITKLLGANYTVQVGFHQLLYKINF